MRSKSLWSLEWTTAEPAQPRLGYISTGLNGIKDSADVSQMNICPLGFCFVGPLLLLRLLFFINGQPGSKVGEPEDPTATALTRTSAQLWFRVHVSEETWSDLGVFCSPPRILIMLRDPFFMRLQVPWRCCVPVSALYCCISDWSPGRNGIFFVTLAKLLLLLFISHRGALIFIRRPFQMRTN